MEDEKIRVEVEERESWREPEKRPEHSSQEEKCESLIASFEAALRVYDEVRERLCVKPPSLPTVPGDVPVAKPDAIARAQAVFANFNPTRVPADVRQDPTYLSDRGNLQVAQRAVIERNLTALAASTVKHSLRLALSREDLARLGGSSPGNDGHASVSIDLKNIIGLIEDRLRGAELYATGYPPMTSAAIEADVEQRLNRIANPGG
jgi:hypothetical protein